MEFLQFFVLFVNLTQWVMWAFAFTWCLLSYQSVSKLSHFAHLFRNYWTSFNQFAEMMFVRFLTKKSSFHLGPTKTCLPCPILVSVWLKLDKSVLKPQYQINVWEFFYNNCSFLFNPTKSMATIGNSFFWLVETL